MKDKVVNKYTEIIKTPDGVIIGLSPLNLTEVPSLKDKTNALASVGSKRERYGCPRTSQRPEPTIIKHRRVKNNGNKTKRR